MVLRWYQPDSQTAPVLQQAWQGVEDGSISWKDIELVTERDKPNE